MMYQLGRKFQIMTVFQQVLAVNVSKNLKEKIRQLTLGMGFQQAHFVKPDVSGYQSLHWQQIESGYHSGMDWLERNTELRYDPEKLHPGTKTILVVRLDYLSDLNATKIARDHGYIAQYALGRDYHKLMRQRLSRLGKEINELLEPMGFRAFVDSAPVLERQLAESSGMGWLGKNTLLLNETAGSFFFLGELFLTLGIDADEPREKRHCGTCTACLDTCPTQAFVSEGILDSGRCISYLTIEHHGTIPVEFRVNIGNRIFGCDDCQWQCPFNKFASESQEPDFTPRSQLLNQPLNELWLWTEPEFLKKTEGSPIRRIGYQRWLRNLAIAIGNSKRTDWISVLQERYEEVDDLVREHVDWALIQLERPDDNVSYVEIK